MWNGSSPVTVEANSSIDLDFEFADTIGESFDKSPVVIPMLYNASATLGRYGSTSVNLVSVSGSGTRIRLYNASTSSVQWYIRLVVIQV